MPTGYTAAVADGTITTLKDFAEACFRGMGVCVTMRDEPSDVPVPESFQVSTYHVDMLSEYKKRLADFVTLPEQKLREYYTEAYTKETEMLAIQLKQNADTHKRYSDMLDLVYKLKPQDAPAGLDLHGFKDFMVDQLKTSIDFDVSTVGAERELPEYMLQFDTWYAHMLIELAEKIKHHSEYHDKEVKKTHERNEWLKAARKMVADAEAEVS